MAVPAAVELVDLALKATTAYERPDLGARLQATRKRLADPDVRVLVVGEFKQGKSQLVNALVNAPVCPVDDDIATAVPTVVRHAETTTVTLVREGAPGSEPSRTQVPAVAAGRVRLRGRQAGQPGRAELRRGRAAAQAAGRRAGPGRHARASAGSAPRTARPPCPRCPARTRCCWSPTPPRSTPGPELEFLGAAMKLCPNVGCVLTKTDLYPHWRRIVELDRGHLRDADIRAEIFPVSSTLRLHGGQDPGRRRCWTSPASGSWSTSCCAGWWPGPTTWTAAPPARTCWPWPSSWAPG